MAGTPPGTPPGWGRARHGAGSRPRSRTTRPQLRTHVVHDTKLEHDLPGGRTHQGFTPSNFRPWDATRAASCWVRLEGQLWASTIEVRLTGRENGPEVQVEGLPEFVPNRPRILKNRRRRRRLVSEFGSAASNNAVAMFVQLLALGGRPRPNFGRPLLGTSGPDLPTPLLKAP